MRTISAILVLGPACALAIGACATPDPEAVLNEFRDRALVDASEDVGGTDTVADVGATDTVPTDAGDCGPTGPVPSGDYFCALSANLARDKPLYMNITFTLEGDVVTLVAQPLVRDFDEDDETPMPNARQPVGDPLPTVTSQFSAGAGFSIAWDGVTILGDANPLTYRDLGGNLTLEGTFLSDDIASGAFGGEVTNPTTVPLNGSKFACQRTDDPSSIDPVYYDETIAEIVEEPVDEPCGEGSGGGEGSGE